MSGLFIGTSGWNYDDWKRGFYPGVTRKDWLAFYATYFQAVEVNATFYRLQKPETLRRWHDETPDEFRFAIKGNRYLTHNKKLHDPRDSVERERENDRWLGNKLAAVIWQLPGNLEKDIERLHRFVEALTQWDDVRHAVEFRHRSWFDDETADCLHRHGIANCQSDAADWPLWTTVTTDLVYVRLHGHTRTYVSAYSANSLNRWASVITDWLAEGRSVHVYFDNTDGGAAPRDALKLKRLTNENN